MNDQQRAAMTMALEALEEAVAGMGGSYATWSITGKEAITALREALAQPQGEPVAYVTEHKNLLPNGLTLLQTNPDCAVQLNSGRDFGWLYMKGADGQWVTHRKLSPEEINEAQDQADDMVVVKRESVLEKMFAAPIANPPVVPQGEPVACEHCIELERLCDATYVAQGADAYNHACDEMERWQEQRVQAGKDAGTTGSLCDGIAWLYKHIDELEASNERLIAEFNAENGPTFMGEPVIYTTPPSSQRADALVEAAIEATKEKAAIAGGAAAMAGLSFDEVAEAIRGIK